MDKLKFETLDLTSENIDKIVALFPNCVTEMRGENGKLKRGINFEMLKQMLSPDVVDGDECYEFTWVGKKASIVEANKPIRKTLRPCPEESKDWDTTENLYIEGDNLEVLKLLQEAYLGKVKMIYIDKTTPRLIQFHTLKNAANPPFLGGFSIFGTVVAEAEQRSCQGDSLFSMILCNDRKAIVTE